MGFNVLLRAYEVFSFPFIGIGANLKTIKEKPDEVKKVVKAMVRANRFIRDDKEGAVRILMEWGKIERGPRCGLLRFHLEGLQSGRKYSTRRFAHGVRASQGGTQANALICP